LIFIHLVDDEDIFQDDLNFIFVYYDKKEVEKPVLDDWNLICIKEARCLEDTNLNEFGNDIIILGILVISDHLNKCLCKIILVFMGFCLCYD